MCATILPIRARPDGKTEPPQAAPPDRCDLPIDSVAEKSGFSTAANLRKHFSRAVHTSPQAYRHTFQDRRAS